MSLNELVEQLADKEHASWARWMDYLFSRCEQHDDGSLTICAEDVAHWQMEIDTPYADLPERIKQSDRDEVERIVPIITRFASDYRRAREDAVEPPPAQTGSPFALDPLLIGREERSL